MNKEEIQSLLINPSESFNLELKSWLPLDNLENQSKIIKGSIALYNNNGGFFIIGFDDNGNPAQNPPEGDIKTLYCADKIQDLISRYASFPFEVKVSFPEKDSQIYPVLQIPRGVETPVGTKKVFNNPENGKELFPANQIYVRTLHSNNTVSTAPAKYDDWKQLIKTCFDNRETDIANFIKRHLSLLTPELIQTLSNALERPEKKEEPIKLLEFKKQSIERFKGLHKEKQIDKGCAWVDFSFSFLEDLQEYNTDKSFLNLITANNPRITGWPIWNVFTNEELRPKVKDGCWEAYINSTGLAKHHIDFWKISPKGYFFHRRALEEDCAEKMNIPPNVYLYFDMITRRIAEAIYCAIRFARALHVKTDNHIIFTTDIYELENRILACYSARRMWDSENKALENTFTSKLIIIPTDTPVNNIAEYVYMITKDLFALFDGCEIKKEIIEEIVNETINRI